MTVFRKKAAISLCLKVHKIGPTLLLYTNIRLGILALGIVKLSLQNDYGLVRWCRDGNCA